jgi:uncharacterized protein
MNRTFAIGTLALCLAVVGTGCSRSPRVTFYTLEPAARLEAAAPAAVRSTAIPVTATAALAPTVPPPVTPAPASAASALAAASVVVGPVTLPELVDRPQLVVRVAPNRVAILESERWAEPLRSQIPRVIAEDLGRLLGSGRVASYLQHSGTEAGCRVLLDIERFEASPGEAVRVEAVWSLRRAGGVALSGRSRVHEAAAGEGYDALVAAYGRALLAVSADLAQAIRAEGAAGR